MNFSLTNEFNGIMGISNILIIISSIVSIIYILILMKNIKNIKKYQAIIMLLVNFIFSVAFYFNIAYRMHFSPHNIFLSFLILIFSIPILIRYWHEMHILSKKNSIDKYDIFYLFYLLGMIIVCFSMINYVTFYNLPNSYRTDSFDWLTLPFEFLYYSFLLSTTLSFQDLLPITIFPKILAMLQICTFYYLIGDKIFATLNKQKNTKLLD